MITVCVSLQHDHEDGFCAVVLMLCVNVPPLQARGQAVAQEAEALKHDWLLLHCVLPYCAHQSYLLGAFCSCKKIKIYM